MAKKSKNWIQAAIRKPGALHKQLGISKDKKIPLSKLQAAAKKVARLGEGQGLL